MPWEHFSHQADMGIRGRGESKQEAFEQAAIALTAVVTDPKDVAAAIAITVVEENTDDELLFVQWINALVYEMATRKLIFSRFDIIFQGQQLTAQAWGEPVDVDRHQPAVEVKGATYTALRVGPDPEGGWVAQCVVDV